MRSSARFLVALLAVTVALAALLAFEAQRATRSHRVTAERALRDYASVAAWEFLSASNELLDRNLADRFGRVLRSPAASPYDSLPPPGVLAAEPSALLPCPLVGSSRTLFAVDFRNGSLLTSGGPLSDPSLFGCATRSSPEPPAPACRRRAEQGWCGGKALGKDWLWSLG